MSTEIKGIMVFYLDVGQLPPFKAEAFLERVKDRMNENGLLKQLKEQGIESMWIPVRPNSLTRVEMVPLKDGCIPVITNTINVDYVLDELKDFLVPPEEDEDDDDDDQ